MSQESDITRLLGDLRSHRDGALEALLPMVYGELRKIAAAYMRRQGPHHTLQPTELLHEAYLKLVGAASHDYRDRTHFYAVAAAVMRNILVDHARAKNAEKRGGGITIMPLQEDHASVSSELELLALDQALAALARLDARKARILELRIFGGLQVEAIAEVMEVSVATVGRELRFSSAWLRKEILGDR